MQKNVELTEQKPDLAHHIAEISKRQGSEEHLDKGRESLAGRLRHGDRAAAAELVDQYYGRIYLFMRAFGHDRQISEDLTQETFLRAWYHIGQLRDRKALNGWLYRIASNVSRLYWRKHRGKQLAALDALDMPEGGASVYEQAGGREQLAHVYELVAELPWKLKEAIVLHYIEDLTIAQAAQAAGVREGTFKSRLNRALEALRRASV